MSAHRQSARHRQQSSDSRVDWPGLITKFAVTDLGAAGQAAAQAGKGITAFARRVVTAIAGEIRIVRGYPVVTTRVIWVLWALAFVSAGDWWHDWFSFMTSLVRFALSAILLARWWRHSGQQHWRATRGRMGEPVATGSDAVINSLVEELQATVAASNARIESLTSALAEAFRAAGHEVPDELIPEITTGPLLRLVPGGGSDQAAG